MEGEDIVKTSKTRRKKEPEEDFAILSPEETGLPFEVGIPRRGNARHDVQVKAASSPKAPGKWTSVAIRPSVEVIKDEMSGPDLDLLRQWVELNRDVINKHENREIPTEDVVAAVNPIRSGKQAKSGLKWVDAELEDDTDEDLCEFTDLGPHLTGLPFWVWVRPSLGLRREVYVGVSLDRNDVGGSDLTQVAIQPDVHVVKGKMSTKNLASLRQWVDLNRDLIVKYWNCDLNIMGSLDVYDAVKSLPLKGKAKRLASEDGYFRTEDFLRSLKPLPPQGSSRVRKRN